MSVISRPVGVLGHPLAGMRVTLATRRFPIQRVFSLENGRQLTKTCCVWVIRGSEWAD
jgi:hypothetical protein